MTDDVPLALDLRVGLPAGLPLTEQRDVDNYMQSVVAELGDARFDAVFGSKRHQDSTLAVAPSVSVKPDRGPDLQVTLTGSYTTGRNGRRRFTTRAHGPNVSTRTEPARSG
jgi:hypothetical protein